MCREFEASSIRKNGHVMETKKKSTYLLYKVASVQT